MRVLLTGSGGFLGSHVLHSEFGKDIQFFRASRENKADTGDTVHLGPWPWGRKQFAHALAASGADTVIHCGGATQAETSQELFMANLFPTLGLLEAVADRPVPPRIILIGSAAEYGIVPSSSQPVSEDCSCRPQHMYGIAKYTQTLAGVTAAEGGMPVLVVRLFNPVGRRMPQHLALPSFARRIVAAAQSDGVLRVGDLNAERDFIAVDEAARLLLGLARLPHWPWSLVNLCSGTAYRLGDVLNTMLQKSRTQVRIEVDPALLRAGDMPRFVGSTDRLRSVGLSPAPPNIEVITAGILAEARTPVSF